MHGKRSVTIDTAIRFERALGFAADSWMRMQLAVDLYDARHETAAKEIAKIKPLHAA